MLSARYDLTSVHNPASFDFFVWLASVKNLGADEVVLAGLGNPRARKWSVEENARRIDTIIKPGPALAGLPWRGGEDGQDIGVCHYHEFAKIAKNGFKPLVSVLPPGKEKYTITLRKMHRFPERNSDETLWREFGARIGAYVIKDAGIEPLDLHERMALYAGAEMNFGVTNGPMGMLTMTHYPYMQCDCLAATKQFSGHGVTPGDQLPFAVDRQYLSWEKPTLDSLMKLMEKIT